MIMTSQLETNIKEIEHDLSLRHRSKDELLHIFVEKRLEVSLKAYEDDLKNYTRDMLNIKTEKAFNRIQKL